MSEPRNDRASVLTWRRPAGEPEGLWERVGELGWLPDSPRIVVQLGQRERSPLLLETARSLVRFVRERRPETRIEVLDPNEGSRADWAGLAVTPIGDGAPIGVTGIAAAEIAIPRLWFEAYTLITMVSPTPCSRSRLASVLDAQAEPLRRMGNRHDAAVLAYEAHRLAPSDLIVACGTVRRADRQGERWWAVGPNDVAVESIVAAAAGASAARLPLIRALARHERLAAEPPLDQTLPALVGYLAAAWLVQANTVRDGVTGAARGMARDAVMIRRNLGKIPGFVRRRLASRSRGAA